MRRGAAAYGAQRCAQQQNLLQKDIEESCAMLMATRSAIGVYAVTQPPSIFASRIPIRRGRRNARRTANAKRRALHHYCCHRCRGVADFETLCSVSPSKPADQLRAARQILKTAPVRRRTVMPEIKQWQSSRVAV